MQLGWACRPIRNCSPALYSNGKRLSALSTAAQARKHAQRSKAPAITVEDDAPQVALADVGRLQDLAKDQLQHQVDVPDFGIVRDKVELQSHLLDELISQKSAVNGYESSQSTGATEEAAATGRRGRRTSRKATAAIEPTEDSSTAVPSTATADIVATAAPEDHVAVTPTGRKGRKTSRRVSSVMSEPDATTAPVLQQQEQQNGAQLAAAAIGSSRRGRRTSRKTTASDPASADASELTTATTAAANDSTSGDTAAKPRGGDGRNTSRRSSVLDAAESATGPAVQIPVAEVLPEAAPTRRGRRTSRKSSVMEPVEAVNDPAAAGVPTTPAKRGRKSSRKSSVIEPVEQPPLSGEEVPAAATAKMPAVAEGVGTTPARRGRKSSRKSSVVEPAGQPLSAAVEEVPATAAESPAEGVTGTPAKRGRKSSRKSNVIEPVEQPAATAAATAPAPEIETPTKPTRRTTRKSSVGDPAETAVTAASDSMPAAAVDTAAAADAATPARRSRGRSSTKTSSMAPAAEATAAPTAAAAPSNRTTKAKLLAHQLAQKTLSTPAAAAAPVAAAAVTAAPAAAAIPESGAVLGSPDAVDDRGYWGNVQLHVGSQAQSDSLIMEGAATESSDDNASGTYEEVLAQVAAEQAAGLADETQIMDPAATDALSAFAHTAIVGSAAAAATSPAAANLEQQRPDAVDISAAIVECFAESPLGEDEEPDVTLAAFDHLRVEIPAPLTEAAKAGLLPGQALGLSDIEAAVEEPYDRAQSATPLEESEEADEALTAFDHMVVDISIDAATPHQLTPTLVDTAAAAGEESATAAEKSLGQHREPSQALTASSHADLAATHAAAAAEDETATDTPVVKLEAAAAAIEAAVDPLSVPVSTGSSSFGDNSSSSAPDGLAGLLNKWISAVMKMFEDWQNALAPK